MRESLSSQLKKLVETKEGTKKDEVLEAMESSYDFNILTSTDNQASVLALSKNRTGLSRDEEISFYCGDDEKVILNNIIYNPSTNKEEILLRQKLFSLLISEQIDLENLYSEKRGCASLGGSLRHLYGVDREERKQAQRENRQAKKRIEQLVESGKFTLENIQRIEDKILKDGKIENDELHEYIDYNRYLTYILSMKAEVSFIGKFAKTLLDIDDPILVDLGLQIKEIYDNIDFPTKDHFARLYIEGKEDEINKLFEQTRAIYKILNKIGAIFAIGKFLKENEFTRVTFDEESEEKFIDAWQFKRKKVVTHRDKDDEAQVLNDSMADVYCDTLVGDIMSGKSFSGQLNEQLRICAQSIGYAPASTANLHIYNRFINIDRALTDSGKGLSAFGEDITNMLKAMDLASKDGKTFLFLDEWGSTTSPEDQALLLTAVLTYLKKNDIKIILATHNEDFVKHIQDNSDYAIYHLDTRLNGNGTVTFHYKLIEGVGEAHILEAAKTLGLPENIHNIAKEYMNGNIIKAKIPEINIPKLVEYTPLERESMKSESKSLMSIMPYDDEIKIIYRQMGVRSDGEKGSPILKRRYRMDMRDSEQASYGRKPDYIPEEKLEYPQLMRVMSDDNDMNNFHAAGMKGIRHFHHQIGNFLRGAAVKTSQEMFEIQKMFEELTKADIDGIEKSFFGLNGFGFHLATSLYHIRDLAEGFNIRVFEQVYKEYLEKDWGNRNGKNAFHIFLAMAKVNFALMGEGDEFLSPRLEIFDKAKALAKEQDDCLSKMREYSNKIYRAKRCESGCECESEIDEWEKKEKEWLEKGEKLAEDIKGLVGVESEAKRGEYILEEVYKKVAGEIYEYISENADMFNLFEIDMGIVKKELNEAAEYINAYDWLSNDGIRFVCAMQTLLSEDSKVKIFTSKLRDIDSVYLNQFANYMDNILETMLPNINDGNDILSMIKENLEINKNAESQWHRVDMNIRLGMEGFEKIKDQMQKVMVLLEIAKMIKDNKLCKVKYNNTGVVHIGLPYNPNEKKEEQVKNYFHFGPDHRAVIKTGANMSGKTKSMKQNIWPLAFANSIGYAPAENLSCPILSGIYWIDRIKAREDKKLSAGGTEVMVWKELLEDIAKTDGVKLGFFDEMWSTIPPSYQTPMTYATVSELIQRGLYVDISHHNHQFIDDFLNQHPEIADAVHFQTNVEEDGTVTFEYHMKKGHTKSQALLVAKTLGMLTEVLEIAEGMKIK